MVRHSTYPEYSRRAPSPSNAATARLHGGRPAIARATHGDSRGATRKLYRRGSWEQISLKQKRAAVDVDGEYGLVPRACTPRASPTNRCSDSARQRRVSSTSIARGKTATPWAVSRRWAEVAEAGEEKDAEEEEDEDEEDEAEAAAVIAIVEVAVSSSSSPDEST